MIKIITLLSILIFSFSGIGQNMTLQGTISDEKTGETLINVSIYNVIQKEYAVSDDYGRYFISVSEGDEVVFSYVGYKDQTILVEKELSIIDINLSSDNALEEVLITSKRYDHVLDNTTMGTFDMPVELIKKIPTIMGEADVFKSLQLLPGVQKGTEGNSGLFVRGGSPDQNLILLDGVPVYNPVHLFGFVSTFNPESIKSVNLIKGGFPARYGGRLSSVVDIYMKEGNKKEHHGTATIGLLASKFMLEGPILKDKASYLITFRRTYLDFLLSKALKNQSGSGYYFYDGSIKVNASINNNNHIYLSFYGGRDKLYGKGKYEDEYGSESSQLDLGWENVTASLRWNHTIGNNYGNMTVYSTKYSLNNDRSYSTSYEGVRNSYSYNYDAGIKDLGLKYDYHVHSFRNHKIRLGGEFITHRYIPGDNHIIETSNFQSIDTIINQDKRKPSTLAFYVEDEIDLGSKFSLNLGLRSTKYALSDYTLWSYEPRLNFNFKVSSKWSIKGSYAYTKQYTHLLSNSTIGIPSDLWLPSTPNVKPMDASQYGIGVASLLGNGYSFTVEAYYKDMKNIISYKQGEGIYGFTQWEDRVTQGDAHSYGMELLLRKEKGNLTGWIGYTLAYVYGKYEDINNARYFPLNHDRRHDFSIVGSYELSPKISITGSWVYSSGQPYTVSSSESFIYQGDPFHHTLPFYYTEDLSNVNNWRMRPYHRLDIGVSLKKEKGNYFRTWSFGAYNLYSRSNPVYVSNGYEHSLFPIIPYANFKIEF